MNAPVLQEGPLRINEHGSNLPLATAGVLRYVWESRFGEILIEVVCDEIFVNGSRVDRTRSTPIEPSQG